MSKKYWFAGVAYGRNGQGETVAVHGHTFEEAAAKFYKKYEELAKDPKAVVDMMIPVFYDNWIEEDGDKDFIPMHTVDTEMTFMGLPRRLGLRRYFINTEDNV